jgi:hypothetical protein
VGNHGWRLLGSLQLHLMTFIRRRTNYHAL